ncbi:MAG: VCBS repeat-containing protein [Flavobacteriales bacterium]|nr:VCBS repeat-containing protein [Flavobacteriales bacterium]
MRKISTLFYILFISFSAFSQDANWFSEITDMVGLTNERMQKAYVVDVNGDQYQDLVTITGVDYFNNRVAMKLFINEADKDWGHRKFVDYTEWSGINSNVDPKDTGRQTTIAAFADVDNDGDVDMVTAHYFHRIENYTDVGDRCQVLLNDGKGKFTVKVNNGLDKLGLTNTQGLSFLDYDLDGNIDLFIGNWFSDYTNNQVQDDILMRGNGDGTFTNVTELTNLNKPGKEPLYGSSAGDWNNDGWTDIFSASYCRTGGSLWKNTADGNFINVASEVGYNSQLLKGDNGQALCHWAAMPCDYDNDGDFDFYFALVHGGNNANEGRSTIVENKGPDSNYVLRWNMDLTPRKPPFAGHIATYDANWFDMDNDGLTDLSNADGTYAGGGNGRIYMFHQNTDHTFTDINKELGFTGIKYNTMSITRPFDYDNDGDEDLLIWGGGNKSSDHVPIFLKNEIADMNNHVMVNLKPAIGTNGSCIGARVEVHSGTLVKTKEVYAGQGNAAGQSQFKLVFGLGQLTTIDSIVVYFPNKKHNRVVLKNPEVNQTHLIYEYINALPLADIILFPNPAKNQTKVAFPENLSGPLEISVHDLSGKKLFQNSVSTYHKYIPIDLSAFSPGCYIVQLRDTSNNTYTKRLLVE